MRYKCLVLDHDDTVVKSTPDIHYPSFIQAMRELRPEVRPYTLEEFVSYCFEPGFHPLCKDILKYSDVEMNRQQEIWRSYTGRVIPEVYDGFVDLIRDFKESGGYICVVSHSEKGRILRDYESRIGVEPDLVFGWEAEQWQRKPNPYPLEEIMRILELSKKDLLMVDDLKPGLDMARSCGVDFCGAGWSHIIPRIVNFMMEESDYYFSDIQDLRELVL